MSWVHVQIKSYNQETKDIKATQKMGSGSLNNQPWQPAWSVTDVERGIEEWTIRLPDHTKFTQLHITFLLPRLLVGITETAPNRAAKKMHAPIWLVFSQDFKMDAQDFELEISQSSHIIAQWSAWSFCSRMLEEEAMAAFPSSSRAAHSSTMSWITYHYWIWKTAVQLIAWHAHSRLTPQIV